MKKKIFSRIEFKIISLFILCIVDFHYIPKLISANSTICVYIGALLLIIINTPIIIKLINYIKVKRNEK